MADQFPCTSHRSWRRRRNPNPPTLTSLLDLPFQRSIINGRSSSTDTIGMFVHNELSVLCVRACKWWVRVGHSRLRKCLIVHANDYTLKWGLRVATEFDAYVFREEGPRSEHGQWKTEPSIMNQSYSQINQLFSLVSSFLACLVSVVHFSPL